jgi:hypothetical protein
MARQVHHEDNSPKALGLILSLSKDEATISCFVTDLPGHLEEGHHGQAQAHSAFDR